jgi:hypothetical protein
MLSFKMKKYSCRRQSREICTMHNDLPPCWQNLPTPHVTLRERRLAEARQTPQFQKEQKEQDAANL